MAAGADESARGADFSEIHVYLCSDVSLMHDQYFC